MGELKIRKFSGACVWPQGSEGMSSAAVFVDGCVLPDTQLSPCLCRNVKRPDEDPAIVKDKVPALFLGAFYNCWGHSLTDSLRFLWVFLPQYAHRIGVDLKSLKLVYVSVGGRAELGKSFCDLLSIIGISPQRMVEIERPTRFTTLYVPEPSFYEDLKTIERHWTGEYAATIAYIINSAAPDIPSPTKTVYFSRSKWQQGLRRKDFGEIAIEKMIRKNLPECEIVAPEELSFAEQVRLLSSCRKLITTEGSLSHNALFLPKGAELVVLRKCWLANRYQKVVNEVRNLNVTVLNASWKNRLVEPIKNPCAGPFFLAVTGEVARHFHINRGFWLCAVRERLLYELVALRHNRVVRNMRSIIKKAIKR